MQHLRYSRYIKTIVIFVDLAVVLSVFLWFFNFGVISANYEQFFTIILLSGFLWILLSGRTKIYEIPRNLTFTKFLERIVAHCLLFMIALLLLIRLSNKEIIDEHRFAFSVLLCSSIILVKTIVFFFIKYFRTLGMNHRNVMFLEADSATDILKKTLTGRKDYGYKVFEHQLKSNDFNALKNFWDKNGIYEIFIPAETRDDSRETLLKLADDNNVRVSLVPNILNGRFYEYDLDYVETQPVYLPAKFPLDYFSNYLVKRVCDVVLSLFFFIFIASWLFPIIAVLIKSDSRGPVFFIQKRYGYKGKIFGCIKFRTMRENIFSAEKTTEDNDSRITRIGKFLRKSSLDETPQFINVLLGDMSVIGPRPHMLLVDDLYKPQLRRYAVRSAIKPGITGLSQVNGLRGDSGNQKVNMQKRILSDAFYVKNWSLGLDFVIVFKTVYLMLAGDKNAK